MSKRRDPLPRLNIAPNINMQQPMGGPGQALYSPALPTSLQQSFHPAFPMANPSSGRPTHHAHQASIQLAAAGIHPPNFMTPVATHFPRPSLMLGPGGQPQAPSHPFPNRNRRQLSIGGPPKAPLPVAIGPNATPVVPVAPQKQKKMIINLPKETVAGEEGEPATRPSWARSPLANTFAYEDTPVIPVDISTADSYPPDSWRLGLPNSIDVYLPGKVSTFHIYTRPMHGRPRYVPTHVLHVFFVLMPGPLDIVAGGPCSLLFKLNKLQQAQEASSAGNSLSVSPQPPFGGPFGLSPSPNRGLHFITNRHGHSMSLAQPPSYQPYSSSPSPFNPLVQTLFWALTQLQTAKRRVPMSIPSFAPPLSAVGGNKTHTDFIRGFGLDVPLESEEEGEEDDQARPNEQSEDDDYEGDAARDMESEDMFGGEMSEIDDGTATAPQSRLHSRHVSKLSAALSLRSVGGNFQAQFQGAAEGVRQEEDEQMAKAEQFEEEHEQPHNQNADIDPAEEWTGSEDLYLGTETSDDESIGEWSNPSDEERARQHRVERRMRRRAQQQQVDQPRRLPNFPRPPETALAFLQRRDDDIISNPSEENLPLGRRAEFMGVTTEEYYPGATENRAQASAIGLPHHSRGPSSQYSVHDPAMAHSRDASDSFVYSNPLHHQSNPSTGRRESLNPFAKPFVFGSARASSSGSWQPFTGQSTPPMPMPMTSGSASFSTHSRLPSLGKPLNVAAPEFKPGAFNFRLPGAPQMPVPAPAAPEFPQPQHVDLAPAAELSPFKVQGREKRQRRGSSASVEEGDSMSSFKFPMKLDTSSPQSIRRRRSGSLSTSTRHQLNASAQPFTFAGFSAVANNMPWVPKESDAVDAANVEDSINASSTAKADNSEVHSDEVVLPPPTKQKRAPIPLDFKHPVSSNTVPAGLFKALVSNEERTRRGVRSRLSSREIFEHSRRPSMDDDNVALIAQRNPRSRLVTDPGERPTPANDDIFGSIRHGRRRSSLPDALHDNATSPSASSVAPEDLSTRVIAQLLDEKLGDLRLHLMRKEQKTEAGVSSATESMMADVISLFRTQLQESATRSLEDSQMDARGEMDFQMIKEVVEEGQKELLSAFQREIHRVLQHVPTTSASGVSLDVMPIVEDVGNRTISAVVEAISELSARQEAVALNAPGHEHDLIVDKLVNVLSPMIHSLQNDPIDYDFLTRELTQAVKPHISQLIDLASDKRETAGLINVTVDTDAITLQLITEVRRAIAQSMRADLVVERLDSRLAVRDKAFNVDIVTSRVTESVSHLLETLNKVPAALDELVAIHKALCDSQSQVLASVTGIPSKVGPQLEDIKTLQNDILEKLKQPTHAAEPDTNILAIKDIVEILSSEQKKLTDQGASAVSRDKVLLDKLNALPEDFSAIANSLQSSLSELITSRDNSKREFEELRKLNTEYQIQVTKARGSHGQVRVEKDVLAEKLAIVEADRDRLRAQTKELQAAASTKATETAVLEARNTELEDALAKALARLQSSDVATQANQRSIADLEKSNTDLTAEKQNLKSKLDSLEQGLGFANKEKQTVSKDLAALQAKHDALVSQQSNWEALNAATEKINMVFHLLENADNEEQKELRHYRDRSKKRFKDMDTKLANNERATATARQSLSQAQQRSVEWERRAKEYEGKLELLQTKFEQAEQTQSQLEADYSLVKLQLEDREADSRLWEDRENKQREQITALESKCILLQNELEKANAAKLSSAASAVPFRPRTNGNMHPPPRPDSRASTIYDGRSDANRRISSYSSARSITSPNPGPETSVWDSMHAPANNNGTSKWSTGPIHTPSSRYANLAPSTPKPHRTSYAQYQRGPSPTPSTVSAAPTQGDDGWWS
ncbi:hypothetical protein BDZ97DRAFT_1787214 [Flammula alnicola]|nr:hypothetical protein BDZ97DRAFT_1787214 [Flammula alnicola]